jgi:hypothetical protein
MALRPFTRNPKKSEDDEETAPTDLSNVREFFSADARPADPPAVDDGPVRMSVPKPSTVSLPEDAEPGWYPDQADPGLVRYWDGFHLTGQSMRIEPPVAHAGEAAAMISPAPGASTVASAPATDSSDTTPAARSADVEAPSRPALIAFDESATTTEPTEKVENMTPPPPPPTPIRSGPAPAAPGAPTSTPAPDRPSTERSADPRQAWTAMRDIGREADEADEADEAADAAEVAEVEEPHGVTATGELVTAAPAGGDDDDELTPAPTGSPSGDPGTRAGDVADWAQETERAVAMAQATGTPDAWQEAARAATVVSEIAQTMRAMAEATRVADERTRAAHEAVEEAKAAEEEAADAKLTAEQSSAAALKAEEAAKVAERSAAEAKATAAEAEQIAERTAQATPTFAAAARAAIEASDDAEKKAKGLEGIVGKARTVNTPQAWSEALVLASAATETGEDSTPEA